MRTFLLVTLSLFIGLNSFLQGSLTELSHSITSSLRSIHFSDENVGWIGTWEGEVFKTTDGGLNWVDVSTPYAYTPLMQIHSWDSLNALISTNDFFYIRTNDGGLSWDSIPCAYRITEMKFKNDTVGYSGGMNGVYKTIDGGLTWFLKSGIYKKGMFFEGNREYLGGAGNLYISSDDGVSFASHSVGFLGMIEHISFLNPSIGVCVGGHGEISKTTNGGATWTFTDEDFGYNFTGIEMLYGGRGYAIYSNMGGSLFQTDDHWDSWNQVGTYSCSGISDMSFPTKCIGYICGLNGLILKYEDEVCDPMATIKADNELKLSAYPNPTTSTIQFNIKVSNLLLVNSMGEEVLAVDRASSVDLTEYPPGVYFVRSNEGQLRIVKR